MNPGGRSRPSFTDAFFPVEKSIQKRPRLAESAGDSFVSQMKFKTHGIFEFSLNPGHGWDTANSYKFYADAENFIFLLYFGISDSADSSGRLRNDWDEIMNSPGIYSGVCNNIPPKRGFNPA